MNPGEREPERPDWDGVAASARFQDLLRRKRRFIVRAFLLFSMYYFCLLLLTAYAPKLIALRAAGTITLGYCFALSQFVVGGTIAWFYLRAATRFDRLSRDLLTESDKS